MRMEGWIGCGVGCGSLSAYQELAVLAGCWLCTTGGCRSSSGLTILLCHSLCVCLLCTVYQLSNTGTPMLCQSVQLGDVGKIEEAGSEGRALEA